jgi:hypothetical protein
MNCSNPAVIDRALRLPNRQSEQIESIVCQVDLRPSYVRTFHFRLIAATALRLHRIRAAISEMVSSVCESNDTIRPISSSLKCRPCTAI